MGSHGSKDGAPRKSLQSTGKFHAEKSDAVASKLHPDQVEAIKLSWITMVGADVNVVDSDSFQIYMGLPSDLDEFVERLFVRLRSVGDSSAPTLQPNELNYQQLLSALELICRSASLQDRATFIAQMYSTEAQTLGKPQLARLFTDLTLLLQYVSDFEMSNYMFTSSGQRKGDGSADKYKPSEIIIDAEDKFSGIADAMLEGLSLEDRAPRALEKPETSGVIVMSKLNIQIPTVKGVSVNPMNESRAMPDSKREPTEEELTKAQLERDMRLTKRLMSGLMRSALEFVSKKLGRSRIETSSVDSPLDISAADFVDWVVQTVPALTDPIANLIHFKFFQPPSLFGDEAKKSYKPSAMTPVGLDMEKSELWGNGIVWALDLFFSDKKPVWKLLYNSTAHGHSLNRFVHHVVGYAGPTLMLIRDTEGHLFGAFVSCPWQISSKFFGDNDCFLFSLDPVFCLRHPGGPERNIAYCFDRKNTHSGFPVGIGFGGTLSAFRLCLQDDLSAGLARQMDSTYDIGSINPTAAFEVDLIEIWGCGGDLAEMAHARSNYVKDRQSEKARKVNRAQASQGWMSGPDKFIMDLLGKTGSSDAYHDELKQARKNMKKQNTNS